MFIKRPALKWAFLPLLAGVRYWVGSPIANDLASETASLPPRLPAVRALEQVVSSDVRRVDGARDQWMYSQRGDHEAGQSRVYWTPMLSAICGFEYTL
jgi:hypothetical protein